MKKLWEQKCTWHPSLLPVPTRNKMCPFCSQLVRVCIWKLNTNSRKQLMVSIWGGSNKGFTRPLFEVLYCLGSYETKTFIFSLSRVRNQRQNVSMGKKVFSTDFFFQLEQSQSRIQSRSVRFLCSETAKREASSNIPLKHLHSSMDGHTLPINPVQSQQSVCCYKSHTLGLFLQIHLRSLFRLAALDFKMSCLNVSVFRYSVTHTTYSSKEAVCSLRMDRVAHTALPEPSC